MPPSLIFWILMLIWLVGGFYYRYSAAAPWGIAPDLVLFILLLILGWNAFGAPIRF